MIEVRRLTAPDLAAYRALHAHGLQHAALAFAETAEQDAARADAEVAALIDGGMLWGAFDEERLVGKLAMDFPPYPAFRHTRWLHAVYVHPDGRGRGVGAALIEGALVQARAEGVFCFLLWVHSQNPSARALYERAGFREIGRISKGIRLGEAYADDVMMGRFFEPAGLDDVNTPT